MSNHILMLNIPAWGHMRPALAVTEELVRRGHRVSFLAPKGFETAIRAAGATAVPYESTLGQALAPGQGIPDQDGNMRLAISFMRESVEVMPQVERLFVDDIPDLVMYDIAVGAAGRALGARWGRPAVQSTPSMASNEHYSHIHEVFRFSGVPADHPGFAEIFTWARNFPMELTPAGPTPERSVVYIPREFQTAGDTFGEEAVFVGHSFPTEQISEWSPPSDGGLPLVIVSMGTLHNGEAEFFRTCVEAFRDRPWRVVITLGRSTDMAFPEKLPPNVEIHSWIPQLAALEEATAFVTATGLGSLMSALLAGTPPVMIPSVAENVVLARRAAVLGLGTLLTPEVTADELFKAVCSLAEDEATRRRVRRMSASMTRSGGAPRAADALEKWLCTAPSAR
ncbi:macrolide family glycosyltransferase [Streptomyces sp. NPDC048639]|uniref:macrolide family glycosyltransferase n=1 Tax=Streptomyces sp. NPDC048639 TaxID=3365581 RepID=UPI003716AABF